MPSTADEKRMASIAPTASAVTRLKWPYSSGQLRRRKRGRLDRPADRRPLGWRASPCLSGASGWSEPVERRPKGDRDGCRDRRAGRRELKDALLDRKPEDVRDDHWKISVVQSPP